MTSKEALERIKNTIIVRRNYNRVVSIFNQEEIETIEKDLDVLDILKRYFKYHKGEITKEETNMSEKDVGRIKEWIEN